MSTTTPDRIRLSGLSARGYHGVLPFERTEGQLFTADVTLDLGERGTAVASVTDEIKDAIDYSEVARAVIAVIEGEPVSLIETLAARVSEAVLGFPRVTAAEVTIHKPQAPLDVAFEDISVTIHRTGGEGHNPLSSRSPAQSAAPEADPGRDQWAAQPPEAALGGPIGAPAAGAAMDAGMAAADNTGRGAGETWAAEGAPSPGGAEQWAGSSADAAPGDPLAGMPWESAPADAYASDETARPWQRAATDDAGIPGIGDVSEPAQPWQGGPADNMAASAAPMAAPVDVLDQRPAQPADVVLALGGNVGGVVPALRNAVRTLRSTEGIEVSSVAPLARTAAIVEPGGPEQPDYLNTVVLASTTLSPREVLAVCQDMEDDAGRVRTEPQGPRTLDVDVITYEGVTSDDPELVLPHPRAAQRAFVLVPWAQADPFAEIGNQYVASLAETAPDRDGVRWLALDWLESDHLPALPTGQYVAPPESGDDQAGPAAAVPEPGGPGEVGPGAAAGGLPADVGAVGVYSDEPVADVLGDPQLPQDPSYSRMPGVGSAPQAGSAPQVGSAPQDDPQDESWVSPPGWGDVLGRGGGPGQGL